MRLEARLARVEETRDGLYEATLEILFGDKRYTVKVPRLARPPRLGGARVEGELVLIDLRGPRGEPLATCCIHRGHLERGCLDCRSLILPPAGARG